MQKSSEWEIKRMSENVVHEVKVEQPTSGAEKEIRPRQRSNSVTSSRCSSQKQHIDKMIDVTTRLHRQIPCDRKVTGDLARREHSGGQHNQDEGEKKQLLNIQESQPSDQSNRNSTDWRFLLRRQIPVAQAVHKKNVEIHQAAVHRHLRERAEVFSDGAGSARTAQRQVPNAYRAESWGRVIFDLWLGCLKSWCKCQRRKRHRKLWKFIERINEVPVVLKEQVL